MRTLNRDEQIRALQNELKSLVISSQALTTDMHTYIHELRVIELSSRGLYDDTKPIKCKFCYHFSEEDMPYRDCAICGPRITPCSNPVPRRESDEE